MHKMSFAASEFSEDGNGGSSISAGSLGPRKIQEVIQVDCKRSPVVKSYMSSDKNPGLYGLYTTATIFRHAQIIPKR